MKPIKSKRPFLAGILCAFGLSWCAASWLAWLGEAGPGEAPSGATAWSTGEDLSNFGGNLGGIEPFWGPPPSLGQHGKRGSGATAELVQSLQNELANLPPACSSGLEGLDFGQFDRQAASQVRRVSHWLQSKGDHDQGLVIQSDDRESSPAAELPRARQLTGKESAAMHELEGAPSTDRQSRASQATVLAQAIGLFERAAGDDLAAPAPSVTLSGSAIGSTDSQAGPENPGHTETVSFTGAYNPHANASTAKGTGDGLNHATSSRPNIDSSIECADPHADVFSETPFPSATQCAKCHQQIYDEWASSSHAYAAVSPMFNRFEDTINQLTQGTIGYFCMRCHAPVATTMGLRRDQPIADVPRVFREGVTCVACHRVKENYTKTNGERRIEPGDIYDPVYSGSGAIGSQIVAKHKDFFKVKTSPDDRGPGQPMHRRAIKFEQLSQSDFCMSCHQVAVQPGIKLEVVWDQYRASPAYRQGITCQDCHMGIVPGMAEGYSIGPAAIVDGKAVTPERKHSNHIFYGPGYSIAHPFVFPDNPQADRWHFNDRLQFDWRSGWGTDAFEDAVAEGRSSDHFPPAWQEPDDRYDARELIVENLNKLIRKKDLRRQLMENSSQIDGPFFAKPPAVGRALRFHYCVTNLNSGHNMPSGSLGAQPQLWLNVVLIDPQGNRIWETGYLDSYGDLADLHSEDVLHRRLPLDKQLFNLQTKFLTTNVKGTDREMYLPINFDLDQLPFIRPVPQPVSVLNHPPLIRMEAHSIPPLGSRKAKYVVPAKLICQPGTYRLSVRMRSRAEPIYFMKSVQATPEMIRMMNEWIVDVHVDSVVFQVD